MLHFLLSWDNNSVFTLENSCGRALASSSNSSIVDFRGWRRIRKRWRCWRRISFLLQEFLTSQAFSFPTAEGLFRLLSEVLGHVQVLLHQDEGWKAWSEGFHFGKFQTLWRLEMLGCLLHCLASLLIQWYTFILKQCFSQAKLCWLN